MRGFSSLADRLQLQTQMTEGHQHRNDIIQQEIRKIQVRAHWSKIHSKLSIGQTSDYQVKDRRAKTTHSGALATSSKCNHSTRNSTQIRTGNSDGGRTAQNAVGGIEQSVARANTV